jgi:uncharacterized protein with HEPN domain
MTDRDKTLLTKIAQEIRFINNSIRDVTKQHFMTDDLLQHAICMSLINIGECANHLSEKFIGAHPEIEWIQIIAVRNIATHGYWQLNMEHIWQALIADIPKFDYFLNKLI